MVGLILSWTRKTTITNMAAKIALILFALALFLGLIGWAIVWGLNQYGERKARAKEREREHTEKILEEIED